jgi:hypothetical protein
MIVRWVRLAAECAATAAFGVCVASGADCPPIDSPPATVTAYCPAVDRVGKAGLRIFLDRRTGRLRAPTREEARALIESGGLGIDGLEPIEIVVHPNGMRSADLKGAFSYEVVSRRNADGSLSMRCIPTGPRADPR